MRNNFNAKTIKKYTYNSIINLVKKNINLENQLIYKTFNFIIT
jgi:hypothetical protein